jgi:hypothetical protein
MVKRRRYRVKLFSGASAKGHVDEVHATLSRNGRVDDLLTAPP